MQVRDVMSPSPQVLSADVTLRQAALQMRNTASGVMPVARNNTLLGMISDRDLVIDGVASGKSPNVKVSDILLGEIVYCYENDNIEDALIEMRDSEVQCLVVLNDDVRKNVVGTVSLADIADKCDDGESTKAIAECCTHYSLVGPSTHAI